MRNAGDGAASATTLRYYRSTNSTIATTDAQEGTDAVDELAASGSSAESIALTAPTMAGIYYYGACVDAVEGESDTTDNCSLSVGADVEAPTAPDLEVRRTTVDDSRPKTGGSFTLSATVRNAGDGAAAATTLRYYRSADWRITTSDAQEGTDAVDELAASRSSAESIALTAPTTSGRYYYGACVDPVEGESDTTDNCSSAVGVDAGAPTAPDLEVVGRPTMDDRRPAPGGSFTLSATVRNAGDGAASATTLRYYRSTNSTIATTDAQEGTDAVDELAASGSSAESIALTAPTMAGIYYYGACVDAVEGESDTTDNCSLSVRADVEAPTAPDLEVRRTTVDDSRPKTGGSFTLSATVRNAGDGAAAATTLRYYRSADWRITTSDAQEGTDAVDELAASRSSAESIALTAPTTSGRYYYGACVDPVEGESDTTDNCSSAVRVDVTAPDLKVGTPTVDDASPPMGVSFTLSATVTNTGDIAASATTLRYYRSADATITTSDAEEGTDAVDELAASGSSAESITLTAPSMVGRYYYGACVDPVPNESNTENNCSAATQLTISEPRGYDLAVDSVVVNTASPTKGEPITFTVTVRNRGDVTSTGRLLESWFWHGWGNSCGAASNPTAADKVGEDRIDALSAGAEREYTVTATSTWAGLRTLSADLKFDSNDLKPSNDEGCLTVDISE